jgi:hypothetical protein
MNKQLRPGFVVLACILLGAAIIWMAWDTGQRQNDAVNNLPPAPTSQTKMWPTTTGVSRNSVPTTVVPPNIEVPTTLQPPEIAPNGPGMGSCIERRPDGQFVDC